MAHGSPENIKGVWATILCRLNEDGSPDLSAIDEQVAAYAAAGCDGVYSGGTASEVHCLTETQFRVISARFAEAASNHGLPFQIGATHPLAQGSLARTAFATTLDPLAIQVTLPDWTPLDFGSVQRFLNKVAEAADGYPLVLYNPPHAKTVLQPDELLAMAKSTPSLVGLKCGGGDAQWYSAMAPVFERLSVFIPGHHYASGTAQGAHGSYSNMACLSPSAAVRWAQMPKAEALSLETRIADFMTEAISPLIDRGLPGFGCDKAMAAAGGWAGIDPQLLWPHDGASTEEVQRISSAARRHIPEFMEPMND